MTNDNPGLVALDVIRSMLSIDDEWTDPVDQGIQGYMSWAQIRELSQNGVTIGSQTASHLHMAAADYLTNQRELEKSNARFKKKLGTRPNLIAYPYGETSQSVKKLAQASGFVAGFGQHSGVAANCPGILRGLESQQGAAANCSPHH